MNPIDMRKSARRRFATRMIESVAVAALALLWTVAAGPASAQNSRIGQTEMRLEPGNEVAEHDEFGESVAVSGNTMVIGGEGADTALPDTGAAWIFERSGNTWVQTAKLIPSDANTRDEFGAAVAISEDGNTVVIAAAGHSPQTALGRFNEAGALYVFQRVNGAWVQEAELVSPTIGNVGNFGSFGVAISGDTIVAGDNGNFANFFEGAVDVFTRVNGSWQPAGRLTVPQDFFFEPASVAIAGSTVVAASPNSNPADPATFDPVGAAYVFDLRNGSGTPQATLGASDPTENFSFGASLATDGDRIVVGVPQGPGASAQSGAAYVFALEDGNWRQEAKLVAADGADGDFFGVSVAVNGETVAVGALSHALTGAAYVFQPHHNTWSQIAELSASDGGDGGSFGFSVFLSSGMLFVGAPFQQPQVDTGAGYPGGEAYVYRLDD